MSQRHPAPRNDILMATRFLKAVGPFLREPIHADEGRRRLKNQLQNRGASFLAVVRDAVYGRPASPYLALLRHAGVEYADVEQLVQQDGVEGALSRLYDAGVHVTLDEFKGRRFIRRGSLEIPTSSSSFDNDLPSQQFVARTGGSRTGGQRLLIDLELLAHETGYEIETWTQFGLTGRPRALWRPAPPGTAGIKSLLKFAKIGWPIDRWFSQSPLGPRTDWRHWLFTSAILTAGRPLARPEHVPPHEAHVIARWLADRRAEGTAGIVDTNASSAVRVCHAAADHGLDIEGSCFRVGGEPFSPGKAAVIARSGCRGLSYYSMSEAGRIAVACANPEAPDDAHVALDKVALLQRDLRVGRNAGPNVPALLLTSIIHAAPRVMINVEIGDYAVLTSRPCGCSWHDLGFTQHVQEIRSYEKLTAEGMHFIGADLETVLDEVLPARFGGGPTDYQLIEGEQNGLVTLTLNVSPRVGSTTSDTLIADAFLNALAAIGPAQRMMAGRWRDAGIIRVVHAEPRSTRAGKILALHLTSTETRHDR